MGILEFGSAALAAFVGTGAAFVALRALSGTLLGHWLAKGLVRYTADVETAAHSKRVVLDRLDANRARFIDKFLADAVKYHIKLGLLLDRAGESPDAAKTIAWVESYRDFCLDMGAIVQDVLENWHLFPPDEDLPGWMTVWVAKEYFAVGSYLKWLEGFFGDEQAALMDEKQRDRRLSEQRSDTLKEPLEFYEEILERCQRYTLGT